MIIILLLYGLCIWGWIQFYKSKSINKWLKYFMPIINALFWLGIFLAQVDSITSVRTFQEKWIRFNNSDASMIFGFVIIPQIIIGTIMPLLVYIIKILIGVVRKHSENKQN